MHLAFRNYGSPWNPTTKELAAVLDAYIEKPQLADIKVLVMNGKLDYVVNTAGNIWQYDRLEWAGLAEYQANTWRPLEDGMGVRGDWKATSDGRLAFVAIDDGGHFVTSEQKEGTFRIVQKWLDGQWHM